MYLIEYIVYGFHLRYKIYFFNEICRKPISQHLGLATSLGHWIHRAHEPGSETRILGTRNRGPSLRAVDLSDNRPCNKSDVSHPKKVFMMPWLKYICLSPVCALAIPTRISAILCHLCVITVMQSSRRPPLPAPNPTLFTRRPVAIQCIQQADAYAAIKASLYRPPWVAYVQAKASKWLQPMGAQDPSAEDFLHLLTGVPCHMAMSALKTLANAWTTTMRLHELVQLLCLF